ncbi:hypothetical protein [Pseudomonas sp. CP4]|uniref:hypothetical protein n=1 Tax=Pseudomonas sp. CP4 TaxID=3388844 RepID=UPI0039EE3A18
MTKMKTLRTWSLSLLVARVVVGVSLPCLAAQAVESTTGTVKGRAPVASGAVVANQTNPGLGLRVGDTAVVNYTFSDPDGDAQSGSTYQWQQDGRDINGATGDTFTPRGVFASSSLSVVVTPRTSALNTDPSVGVAVVANGGRVGAVDIGRFLAPVTNRQNWSVAENYCLSNSARLPTSAELVQLFASATSNSSNTEMCSKYGWPLNAACGGGDNRYWTSSAPSATGHIAVDLSNGSLLDSADAAGRHVTCIR